MKKNFTSRLATFFCTLLFLITSNAFPQVGIGTTTPNADALLEVDAATTVGGLLLPRLALTATNSVLPLSAHVEGMTVYNTATAGIVPNNVNPGYYYNDGAQWVRIADASAPSNDWAMTGNGGTVAATNFLGTTDNIALRFRTFNGDRFEISNGDINNRGRLRAFENGSSTQPTYSWTGNIGTGIFQQAANVIGFSTNGSERFRIPDANQVHANSLGTNLLPFYSFTADANTGVYSPGGDQLSFSTNGLQRFTIPDGYQVHANSLGTNALPFYSFSGDANTGFYSTGADQLGFSTAGAERMRILANGQIAANITTAIANTRLTVAEAGTNRAIIGYTGTGEGVRGESTSGDGVIGLVTTGRGVYGQATSGTGVSGRATSANARGGYFLNIDTNGYGLWSLGGGTTLYSFANSGTGAAITGRAFGTTSVSTAVNGEGIAGIGDNILGLPARPLGIGVVGYGYQAGVFGDSGYYGQNGVHGSAEGNPGLTTFGTGVYGENVGGLGNGVFGESTNVGVRGYGPNGAILESNNINGFGAVAWNTNAGAGNRVGLLAIGQNLGPIAFAGTGGILYGTSSGGAGFANAANGTGLIGVGNNITTAYTPAVGSGVAGTGNTVGVYGKGVQATDGVGVIGLGNNGLTYTIPANGAGVAGTGVNLGVFGHATNPAGYGVYSSGDLYATGDITSGGNITTTADVAGNGFSFTGGDLGVIGDGTIGSDLTVLGNSTVSGTKSFMIDDPRDPANKYLKHFSIESNEILNIYRGVITFDGSGEAVVKLPDYYDAINKNASYQLTPIGASMPNLYIAAEVNNGIFAIAGGVAGKKVSWTLTAERNDPYIQSNPEVRNVVVDKGADRGQYLAPEVYGQSADKGIINNRVSKIQNSSTPSVAKQTIGSQEMQSKTVEATKLDAQLAQSITTPLKKSSTENNSEKVLRNVPLTKAEKINESSAVKAQAVQNSIEGSDVPQQTSENEQAPTKNLDTQNNK